MSTQQRTLGSVADLMAGLMMVFLFIAIAYMIEIKSSQSSLADQAREADEARKGAEEAREQAESAREDAEESRKAAEASKERAQQEMEQSEEARGQMAGIAEAYFMSKDALDRALHAEFDKDLQRWKAEIENGSIRFLEPDILFDTSSAEIKEAYRGILDDFFPRYLRILQAPQFRDEIEEVRIEGHTSTEWRDARNKEERYLKNAELSQQRAFAVLDYCFALPACRADDDWLITILRANGFSFANPIREEDGEIDSARSRRVEFRVITRTTERIRQILETGDEPEEDRR
jgi:chemotaxis protein MotB